MTHFLNMPVANKDTFLHGLLDKIVALSLTIKILSQSLHNLYRAFPSGFLHPGLTPFTGSGKLIMLPTAILLVLCLSCDSLTTSTVHEAPGSLMVEDLVNPAGIGDPAPKFSWITGDYSSGKGKVQSAYQVIVASSPGLLDEVRADAWNSGKVNSDNSAYIRYEGKILESRGVYYWKVRTWDGRGKASSWSSASSFEMGLLSNADWGSARWIWRDNKDRGTDYSYFRKAVELPDKPIARARVYITASNQYELHVNGELAGKGPNFAYPDEYYYQTLDIGPYLAAGQENLFGLLCVHWGDGGQGRPRGERGLLFKAVIEFNDGTSLVTGSDRTWKAIEAAEWINTNVYRNRGEGIPSDYIDGRLHPVGWNTLQYDDSVWSDVIEIGAHPVSPWVNPLIAQITTITEYEISPVQVTRIGDGHLVADFGKVYTGMPKLAFSGGRPGTLIRVKADYRVREDGTLEGVSAATRMDYEYTLRGGEEIFLPFWYLGFRYLEVENAPPTFDGRSISMIVRHHKVDTTLSSFECSDPIINNTWHMAKRSAKLSSHEHFVDNPTREQGQFMGDGYTVSVAAMKSLMERNLSRKAIREFAWSQDRYHANTGKVNAAYPYDRRRDIPDWTQQFIFWAWDYYVQTGDRELIGEGFDQLVNTGHYHKNSENEKSGLIDWGARPVIHDASELSYLDLRRRLRRTKYSTGLIDWPDDYGYDACTSQRTVLNINAYLNYLYLSRLAGVLDKNDVRDLFQQHADDILSAIRRQLWDDNQRAYIDGLYEDGTSSKNASQQANAMMLALSLEEEGQEVDMMNLIKSAGHSTGVLLIRFLIQAYAEHGEEEALFEYLTNPEGHNWAYTLANGGTFTWENWRLYDPVYCESQGFGAIGAVNVVQDYILGIKPLSPQYARVQVKPCLTGKLSYARGKVPTQRGQVFVDWQNDPADGSFEMTIKIPFNMIADVYVPRNGARGTDVKVNGVNRRGKPTRQYLLFEGVQAGEHLFVRELN